MRLKLPRRARQITVSSRSLRRLSVSASRVLPRNAAVVFPLRRLEGAALRSFSVALLLTLSVSAARAEYVVLRSGARLTVTGYELIGDRYKLQMNGGTAEILAAEVVGIEPQEIFDPLPEPLSANTPFDEIIRAAADRYGVDPDLIHSVIAVESNFNPKAVSRRNARGLMQLLPNTAARLGVKNIFDPKENVDGGTRYLRDMLARYNNDVALALAAYNAGPESVEKYGKRIPPYPETRQYIDRIARTYAKSKRGT